jgi:signal transduction histidine kinase
VGAEPPRPAPRRHRLDGGGRPVAAPRGRDQHGAPGDRARRGLLIALALAVALRLAIKLERRARLLSHTNRRLGLEVEQRRQAELKLQEMAHALEERVAARTRELAAANENLERSNEDLRQFGAFVAHELRQPIATAQIWADVLEQKAGDNLGESAQAPLGKLRTAIERMKGLVEKELRLAADATQEATMERVSLGTLLVDVVGELRPRIEQAGARVELGSLPVVQADPSLLRRLFVNLLENALKHARPGTPLVVRVDADTLAAENGVGPRHQIRVADNGRGFPPGEAKRIFEIFARVPGSSDAEGKGLGLAICRRIAERHLGSIRAEGDRRGRDLLAHITREPRFRVRSRVECQGGFERRSCRRATPPRRGLACRSAQAA